MQTSTRVALCGAFWCACMLPAAAASYQLEIIVFAYAQPDVDGEQWNPDGGLPTRQGLALLGAGGEGGGPEVTPLPATSYRLNGVMAALRRGGKYRPLLHASWLQPETGRIRGVFVSAPPVVEQVMGSVRLRVTRFLHVDMDMAYFPGAAPDVADAGAVGGHVRLQESRKIKLNEVHYFDHPLFGVLLQVSRAGGAADADSAAPQE